MCAHAYVREREREALGAPLTYQISDGGDQDGPRNISFIQTPDMSYSPRRLHLI